VDALYLGHTILFNYLIWLKIKFHPQIAEGKQWNTITMKQNITSINWKRYLCVLLCQLELRNI
jgi:hypothetical protein